jgi:uncharacterized membrane protein YcaP (DUF421 family)
MAVTLIRTLVIYITLVIVIRLMGKSQIGEMQPFEFIVTLIIADLACVPMADVSIPLIYGIVGILTLFLLHQVMSFIEKSGNLGKFLVSGKPSLVLTKDGVDVKELKKNSLGVEDLMESMRTAGYYSFEQLDYAIFESNGKLSAFEKEGGKLQDASLPLIIICEGKINKRNVGLTGLSESDVKNFIKNQNVALSKVDVMTIDGNGKVYFQAKKNKYKLLSLSLPEGIKW